MARITRTSVLTLLALALLGALARAAAPVGGATYTGRDAHAQSMRPQRVTLRVARSGRRLTFVLGCTRRDGGDYTFTGVPVSRGGRFAFRTRVAGVWVRVAGRFTSRSAARGRIATFACFVGPRATFSVRRR